MPISGGVVVDASGRACLIGNQLQLKADVPGLHKASLWGYFRGGKRLPGMYLADDGLIPGSGRA